MTKTRSWVLLLTGASLLTACEKPVGPTATSASPIDYAPDQEFIEFRGDNIPLWSLEDGRKIKPTTETTFPYVLPSDPIFSEKSLIWDYWPIRNRDGSIAQFGPWKVIVGMTASRGGSAGGAGLMATYRYWYTKGDGVWLGDELIFDDGAAIGTRTWSGSTMYDPVADRIHVFYTAIGNVPGGAEDVDPSVFPDGHPAANRPSTAQQMATSRGDIHWDDERVWFDNWSEHKVILSADGTIYQTQLKAEVDAVIYGFRDPWYFQDPNTKEDYLLFVGNAAYAPGTHNGVVGVAHRVGEDQWELQNPILQSGGISSQLERPHLVFTEDYTYMFFTTHGFTFKPTDLGPEGAYGFYVPGGDWRGNWEPLNEGGLVAGNPPSQPALTYSWLVLPDFQMYCYQKVTPFSDFLAVPCPVMQLEVDGPRAGIKEVLTPIGPYSLPKEVPAGPASVGPSGGG